jgi:cell division protein FtsQ
MVGEPIFKAVPAQIEANLHTAYSDLASIKVKVGFPNHITVDVVERMPVLAWYQNGVVTWIDASGVAFTPRGYVQGLIQVAATGAPTKIPLDTSHPIYDQKFITPEMVQAMTVLAQDVPAGMPMTFDPVYGMGWQDPRGWSVYFGQDAKDISMKKNVYQAIVDTLLLQGVQPTLISVEYLNAPFYK